MAKLQIFGQNFDLWSTFRFLAELQIFCKSFYFGQTLDFWLKYRFVVNISSFGQNFRRKKIPRGSLVSHQKYLTLNFLVRNLHTFVFVLDFLCSCKFLILFSYLDIFSESVRITGFFLFLIFFYIWSKGRELWLYFQSINPSNYFTFFEKIYFSFFLLRVDSYRNSRQT
mgnify:CR=1 FL=1